MKDIILLPKQIAKEFLLLDHCLILAWISPQFAGSQPIEPRHIDVSLFVVHAGTKETGPTQFGLIQ